MIKPSPATLLAVPHGYTPGTDGPKRGKVVKVKIESEADAEKYRGQLAGRIVLLGDPRDTANPEKAQFLRYSDAQLDDLARYDVAPARRPPVDRETAARRLRLQRFLRPFFVAEKALATIEVSPTDAGIVLVGRGGCWVKGEDPGVPVAGDGGRAVQPPGPPPGREAGRGAGAGHPRPLPRRGPHRLQHDRGDPGHGQEGRDRDAGRAPRLLARRHRRHRQRGRLRRWRWKRCASCKALDVKPRRTIRIALWTGEEQGLLGSKAYVAEHFGHAAGPRTRRERDLPSCLRRDARARSPPSPSTRSSPPTSTSTTARARSAASTPQGNAAVAPDLRGLAAAAPRPRRDHGDASATPAAPTTCRSTPSACPASSSSRTRSTTRRARTTRTMDVYDRLQKDDLMQAAVVMAAFAYDAAMQAERLPRGCWCATSPRRRTRRPRRRRRRPPSGHGLPRVAAASRAAAVRARVLGPPRSQRGGPSAARAARRIERARRPSRAALPPPHRRPGRLAPVRAAVRGPDARAGRPPGGRGGGTWWASGCVPTARSPCSDARSTSSRTRSRTWRPWRCRG